ncbi:hypothetical protein B0H10DRAFT_1975967 [Mycena sp. CBHHK59/15]|nr:hypothetical protein B0H10DRAFT_1975967 [Mycena sp. CBHHK59/15]
MPRDLADRDIGCQLGRERYISGYLRDGDARNTWTRCDTARAATCSALTGCVFHHAGGAQVAQRPRSPSTMRDHRSSCTAEALCFRSVAPLLASSPPSLPPDLPQIRPDRDRPFPSPLLPNLAQAFSLPFRTHVSRPPSACIRSSPPAPACQHPPSAFRT